MPIQTPDNILVTAAAAVPAGAAEIDSEPDLTDEELDALTNDPAAKWCTADEVMARLREIDACSP